VFRPGSHRYGDISKRYAWELIKIDNGSYGEALPKKVFIVSVSLEVIRSMSWMNRKSYINIYQIILDAICLMITYIISYLLTGFLFRPVSLGDYLWIPVLFAMVYIFTMFTCEMYHRSTFTYQDRTLRYILKACMLAALFCLVMMPFASQSNLGIDFLMIYFLSALIVICIQSLIIQELRLSNNSRWKKRAVLVGNRENIQEYLYFIKKTSFQVESVGYVTLDTGIAGQESEKSASDELVAILRRNVVDEVIFALPCGRFEEIKPLVQKCQERGLTVRIAMDFMETQDSDTLVHTVGTIPVFTFQNACLNDVQSVIKRMMDIFGALIGLVIMALASIFIIPMILIQTGGPILCRSPYISLNGRPFTLYRFRISDGINPPASFIGKLLRRTGMDHLPMFWNVLRGDMSLVGSLPVPAVNLDLLTNEQFKNFCIRPGLTGTWRFADNDRKDDEKYLTEMNLQYIKRWSFMRDVWLLFKTVVVVLTRKSHLTLLQRLEDNQSTDVGYNL